MRAIIRRWGNSAAVRIPAAILETAALSCDQAVEVRAEAGQIVIAPVRRDDLRLAHLVAQITDENLHQEVDFGAPVGRERL
ncbi:MAG: AbrB/MazE/SpoVT family DNA-binding domain-containing protein [Acetobacteraceae bacterium]